MNPLQRYAILQSRKLAAQLNPPKPPRKLISTPTLVGLVRASNGPLVSVDSNGRTMLITPPSLSELQADVALCVGGGNDPLAEYELAHAMCKAAGKTVANFVCNDTLGVFPGIVHHGCTLHPDKWQHWRTQRQQAGHPDVLRLWAHRPYTNFTNWTKDWQGSSGLFMVKVARELGYTHIILCGIPMTVEGEHFLRKTRWNAAYGFQKGWDRIRGILRPFVRSMSGWTEAFYGRPDEAWLAAEIGDPNPMKGLHDHTGIKA